MGLIDFDQASALVKQLYPNAADPMLSYELENTKGQFYRPYLISAKFMLAEYRQLIKADEVSFAYDIIRTAKNLLSLQKLIDKNDNSIPEGQSVDDILGVINHVECEKCVNETIGINIY
jgi:hypothetical protein